MRSVDDSGADIRQTCRQRQKHDDRADNDEQLFKGGGIVQADSIDEVSSHAEQKSDDKELEGYRNNVTYGVDGIIFCKTCSAESQQDH